MSPELEDIQKIMAAGYVLVIEDLETPQAREVGVCLVCPDMFFPELIFRAGTVSTALQRARAWAVGFPRAA